MGIGLLLLVLAALVRTADGSCHSTTLFASTSRHWESVYASAYNYCEIKISPNTYYVSPLYYLEISWSSSKFDVKGNMPFCKEDYIEVFLTREYRSIGKFCSNNAGEPFTMYSRDAYAKIVFSTNGYGIRSGFTFKHRLRYKSSYPLGGRRYSSRCYNTDNHESSGVIFSTGWPYSYRASYRSCNFEICKSYGYQGTYVVFMDINMYNVHNSQDYVQLYGYNASSHYSHRRISPKLCSTSDMKKYITYSRYLEIEFDREHKPSYYSSYRGFVAGYVMFRSPKNLLQSATSSPTSSLTRSLISSPISGFITEPASKPVTQAHTDNSPNKDGILLGTLIPIVIIIIIVIAVVVYSKKKQKINACAVGHTPTTNTLSTTQQITTDQMLQDAAAPPTYASLTFCQSDNLHPSSSIQTVAYFTESTQIAFLTSEEPYPTIRFSTAGIAPPPYSLVDTSTSSSIPARALQVSLAPVTRRRQMQTVEVSTNAPPPSYSEVIGS